MTISELPVDAPAAGSPSSRPRARRRLPGFRSGRHGELVQGSLWLVASVVLNGFGGFAFWWVAASTLSTDTVGSAQQLFTAVMVITYLTSMGLPIAVARYSRDDSRASQVLMSWALVITTASSVAGVVGYLALAPGTLREPIDHLPSLTQGAFMLATVTGMSYAILIEVRLMALRRWSWVVARVALVVGLRFPLLAFHPADEALWLVILIGGTPAVSGFLGALVLRRLTHVRARLRPLPSEFRPWARYAGVNYLGLLASQGPNFLLPLIVALNVDNEAYAPFYIAWGITTVLFLVPHMLGQTLLVEAFKDGADFTHQLRIAYTLAVAAMAAALVASLIVAPVITRLLGEDYRKAQELLPWMVGAALPWAFTSISLARARALEHTSTIVAITAIFFAATLGMAAWLTPRHGVDGAAQAWFLGNVVTAGAALVTLVPARPRLRGPTG